MSKRILITGGAGFVGTHLANELLIHGYEVRILDNLTEQVHSQRPEHLAPEVELIVGDVRDPYQVRHALNGVDAVFHLAAMVGINRSLYQMADYTSVNCYGTAVLLEEIVNRRQPIERLVVTSSMRIYGEGLYCNGRGQLCTGPTRRPERIEAGQWEVCDELGTPLQPLPTTETTPPSPTSIYALSKYEQEQMCLIAGRAYDIPTVALRLFNTYGPQQATNNPYSGILAIFAARLLNDQPALVYEDGAQLRDFVHVADVATACRLALEAPAAAGEIFNIGSGRQYSILEIAEWSAALLGKEQLRPEVTGQHRSGDIRHCFADVTKAYRLLGYEPQVSLEAGLEELLSWLSGQIVRDRPARLPALRELNRLAS